MTTLAIALLAWHLVGSITTAAVAPTVVRRRNHRKAIEARREEIRTKMVKIVEIHALNSWSVSRLCYVVPTILFDECYAAEINRGSIAREVLTEGEALGILYRRPSNWYTFFYTKK